MEYRILYTVDFDRNRAFFDAGDLSPREVSNLRYQGISDKEKSSKVWYPFYDNNRGPSYLSCFSLFKHICRVSIIGCANNWYNASRINLKNTEYGSENRDF